MAAQATLSVDLAKIAENARRVVNALPGIDVVGVTKGTCGTPAVARAMLAGGVVAIGESRHENAERLRAAGIEAPLWLLRGPAPQRAAETVRLFDLSLVSELATCEALDRAAAGEARRHQIVAMVELGDLREGMMPAELPAFVDAVERLEHLELTGIGTNLTCYGAIMPDKGNMALLADLGRQTSKQVRRPILVSGGNSGGITLAAAGGLPAEVTGLRVGETILLGLDTLTREPILDLHPDAFTLTAPVIECKLKPSLPTGVCAQDAYGNVPTFEDHGPRRRAICAVGRQDCQAEGLVPLDPRVVILGASGDHLILDVEDLEVAPRVGDELAFRPSYAATLELFTSPYVPKVFTPPA